MEVLLVGGVIGYLFILCLLRVYPALLLDLILLRIKVEKGLSILINIYILVSLTLLVMGICGVAAYHSRSAE